MTANRAAVLLLVVGLLAAGCSFTIGETAGQAGVELIEGDFVEQTGVAFTDASCTEPPDDEVGSTFTCTAQYDGQRVDFDGEIDAENSIYVEATNIIFADQLAEVEQTAVAELNAGGVVDIDVECGEEAIVLSGGNEFVCDFLADGERYDITATVDDLSSGDVSFVIDDAYQNTEPFAFAAVQLIEGDLADSVGASITEAACDPPATPDLNETFACTALLDGAPIDIVGTIDGPDSIFVEIVNFSGESDDSEAALVAAAGVDLIVGDLADSLGITFTGVACDEPIDTEIDTTFACTGQYDGADIEFRGIIDGPDSIFVNATNLIVVDELALVERATEAELEAISGEPQADRIDCGDRPIPLRDDGYILCSYAFEGDLYDVDVTITDPATGAFSFVVAEEPR